MRALAWRLVGEQQFHEVIAEHGQGFEQFLACMGDLFLHGIGHVLVSQVLAALAVEIIPAPATLVPRVMSRIGVQDSADPRKQMLARVRARYATATGVAVATAAAVATGLLRRRSRALS